jgi:hypothetical protein
VQRALNKDLDAIAAQGDEFGAAVGGLQEARNQFGVDRADIDVFKKRAVDKLLGKDFDPSAEDFGKKILAMDKQSFGELLSIADDAGENLGAGIRAAVFGELSDKYRLFDVAESTAARAATQIDVAGLVNEMNRMPFEKFTAFIGTDLPATDVRKIRNTMVTLQAIAEGASAKIPNVRGMRERFEQFAINAASQDKGFVSRLLAGELAPGAMERLLFTPEGQRALSRLGSPRIGRAEFAQSATIVMNAMREDEQFKQELETQRGQRQQAAQLERVGNIPL